MNASRGFTLLETLAVLLLLALLLLGAYSGLKVTTHTAQNGSSVAQRLDDIRSSQQFLRNEYTQILLMPWEIAPDGGNVAFRGDESHMSYIAPLPGYLQRTGLQLQRLVLVKDSEDSYRLEVAFAGLPSRRGSPFVPGEPEVLLRGIKTGKFLYAGDDDQGKPLGWQPKWPYPSRLPKMIAVDLELAGPVTWPRLEVPLRMDVAAINQFTAASRLSAAP